MVLAVEHGDPHIHHRVARDGPAGHGIAHALFHGRYVDTRDHAALDGIDKLEARAARQRLDPQTHLAKLAGAAGLLLVAVVAFGGRGGGFSVGDAWRMRVELEAVLIAQPVHQQTQVQLAQAVNHGLVGVRILGHLQADVFFNQPAQHLPQPLFVAAPLGRDGQPVHRHREGQWQQADVIVLGRVVQHGVKVQFIHLGDGAEVAGDSALHFHGALALQQVQMGQLERLAPIAHIQLHARRERALVHPQNAQLAHVGIDRHLEHMGQHVQARVGQGLHRLRRVAFALQEGRRIAFARVGQQVVHHVQQLTYTSAGAGRREAHRDEVAFAQGLLQRGVQFAGVDVASVQVALDKGAIHFHDLLYQRAVSGLDQAQVGLAGAVEEAIEHLRRPAVGLSERQVQRQALLAEGGLDVGQQGRQIHALRVDLVDDDDPIKPALGGMRHHAQGHGFDAGDGVDHHRDGVHRLQCGQAVPGKVGGARGVDEVDPAAAPMGVHHRGVQ